MNTAMKNFTKCNKITGFYSSMDSIHCFSFKVQLKEINKGIALLKNNVLDANLDYENKGHYEERIFTWQEKVIHTKELNEDTQTNIDTNDSEDNKSSVLPNFTQKIISYVNEDNYDIEEQVFTGTKPKNKTLSEKIYRRINSENGKNEEEIKTNSFDRTLNSKEDEEKMFIVADMNDHKRDPTSILKREHILFTIIWNKKTGSLTVSPDFNDLEDNPYVLEVAYGSKQIFHYSITQINEHVEQKKLAEISVLNKISQQENNLRLRKKHKNFTVPSKETLNCVVVFEILTGYFFEYDHIYVEYTIEFPYGYHSKNPSKGKTQTSSKNNKNGNVHFGHLFEISIDYDLQRGDSNDMLPIPPQIYFEIISSDSWGRQRTEGYCYTEIPVVNPGYRRMTLNSIRPLDVNQRLWNMKRFFVGGRHILKDITWISKPSTFQGNCLVKYGIKCVNSGKLDIAMNVIVQNQSLRKKDIIKSNFASETENNIVEKLHVDSLFRSVNSVLNAYKSAKEKLLQT
ncbi:Meckel syndrome, type 1 [Arctopsyche grandis]|uniref:Meckel syndrome, type 1 n=1 Tax=Arctopsyche grandis TaxID=121162 RepID=UPI00406D9B77